MLAEYVSVLPVLKEKGERGKEERVSFVLAVEGSNQCSLTTGTLLYHWVV